MHSAADAHEDTMENVPATPEPRYTELDSLRGVAALTVVFHHFRLMWLDGSQSSWLKLANPFTGGHQAVMLFFLLSGFVLSVPYLRGRGQGYPVYLLRRILRIYGPYFFALVLAVLGAAKWHGTWAGGNWWSDSTWTQPLSRRLVAEHVLMIGNYNWQEYNTAFWSLVMEMRISIVFPLLYLLVRRIGAKPAAVLALAMTVGSSLAIARWPERAQTLLTVEYAAIFVCGILLATHVQRVSAWYRGLGRWRAALFAAAAFALYTWGANHMFASLHAGTIGLDQLLVTAGAAGYMVLAMNAHAVRIVLNGRVCSWLGRISYSLYLVHGTVLFALAHTLGWSVGMVPLFAIALTGSLLLAHGFHLAVEEPFLKLSRRVARLDKARRAPLGGQVAAAGPAS